MDLAKSPQHCHWDFELKDLDWAQAFMVKLRELKGRLLQQKLETHSYEELVDEVTGLQLSSNYNLMVDKELPEKITLVTLATVNTEKDSFVFLEKADKDVAIAKPLSWKLGKQARDSLAA